MNRVPLPVVPLSESVLPAWTSKAVAPGFESVMVLAPPPAVILTVTFPEKVNALSTAGAALTVTVMVEGVLKVTKSPVPGTPLGDQLAAIFQVPLAPPAQTLLLEAVPDKATVGKVIPPLTLKVTLPLLAPVDVGENRTYTGVADNVDEV